ncbi:MAG: bifunctional adenosylcobinamide kinase/adenosylcobinamide-phosphate guanylyltransferase [Oscillospiraceae bacterium]|nr:bifunctional adenosylcobinamide kinase/adenosylcobinamide-phosphate guanylyltransferase [Oscillospiraceae bacterium]
MGRQILVLGSNQSGKSRFAEKLISCTEGKRHYIATMISSTEDNAFHIKKHIKQREGLGFETHELPYSFAGLELEADSVVLLEDVSNLLANLIFDKGLGSETVLGEINKLRENCALLVIVSIHGLSTQGYEGETAQYINALNSVNSKLLESSDTVVAMEERVPVIKKGEIDFADKSVLDSVVHI